MTLLHVHHDDLGGFADTAWLRRTGRRIAVVCRRLHRGITRARVNRSQSGWMTTGEEPLTSVQDATRAPQRPLVLGDKWDF